MKETVRGYKIHCTGMKEPQLTAVKYEKLLYATISSIETMKKQYEIGLVLDASTGEASYEEPDMD